ncbi:MAG: hypothetical protein HY210_06330 [Candidatus Omnitrophica bacterium]|nr:hypothetical protein [Candidatus Omnitrophota bacterium]MBI5024191.1 hypothetical protein [Candidatus Omnitrophota bacterium]
MKGKSKSLQLQIRVSPREKETIARYAKMTKMGMSEWILSKALPPGQQAFQGLLAQLNTAANPKYILAQIHDMLNAAGGDEFELMVAQPPGAVLTDYLANYVAAMIEYTAVQKGRKTPSWTRQVPPLKAPVFGSDFKSLQLYLLTHSPPPFRRRNIFIDATVGQRV